MYIRYNNKQENLNNGDQCAYLLEIYLNLIDLKIEPALAIDLSKSRKYLEPKGNFICLSRKF